MSSLMSWAMYSFRADVVRLCSTDPNYENAALSKHYLNSS